MSLNMLKSWRKRGAAWRRRNDAAIRLAISADCSVVADMVGPSMNSKTMTSRAGITSSTLGPIPVVASALVLCTSLTRSTASSALDMLALNHSIGGDGGRHNASEHLDLDAAAGLEIDGQV